MFTKKPWKKNLRTIPPQIQAGVENLEIDTCVVACAIRLDFEKIKKGLFNHLDIYLAENGLQFPEQIIPPAGIGIYSRRNREGQEIVFEDEPKITKSWSITVPNYGKWSKGDHDITFSKEIYQRDFIGPKLVAIKIEHLGEDIQKQAHILKFTVVEVLNRTAEDFHEQLLFNLNLLQENIGNCGIHGTSDSLNDYLKTLYINWEILPPGDREETLNRILGNNKNNDPKIRQVIADRFDFLLSLKPQHLIKGTNEFRRYFGAQFAHDLVAFENIEYGNAIYVMFTDWVELSKKSRTELLNSKPNNFERISHTKTWKKRFKKLIGEELFKRKVTH